MDDLINSFKTLTEEANDELVSSFINSAMASVLAKTNRSKLIPELNDYVLQLAIARYNKQGNEGLSSYNEGGESESYLSESEILSGIELYRLSSLARRMQGEKKKLKKIQS